MARPLRIEYPGAFYHVTPRGRRALPVVRGGPLDREVAAPSPWDKVVGSTVLGSRGFVEWVQETFIAAGSGDREVPAARALAARPSLDAIEAAVARGFPEDSRLARELALYLSHRHGGRFCMPRGLR